MCNLRVHAGRLSLRQTRASRWCLWKWLVEIAISPMQYRWAMFACQCRIRWRLRSPIHCTRIVEVCKRHRLRSSRRLQLTRLRRRGRSKIIQPFLVTSHEPALLILIIGFLIIGVIHVVKGRSRRLRMQIVGLIEKRVLRDGRRVRIAAAVLRLLGLRRCRCRTSSHQDVLEHIHVHALLPALWL